MGGLRLVRECNQGDMPSRGHHPDLSSTLRGHDKGYACTQTLSASLTGAFKVQPGLLCPLPPEVSGVTSPTLSRPTPASEAAAPSGEPPTSVLHLAKVLFLIQAPALLPLACKPQLGCFLLPPSPSGLPGPGD